MTKNIEIKNTSTELFYKSGKAFFRSKLENNARYV